MSNHKNAPIDEKPEEGSKCPIHGETLFEIGLINDPSSKYVCHICLSDENKLQDVIQKIHQKFNMVLKEWKDSLEEYREKRKQLEETLKRKKDSRDHGKTTESLNSSEDPQPSTSNKIPSNLPLEQTGKQANDGNDINGGDTKSIEKDN